MRRSLLVAALLAGGVLAASLHHHGRKTHPQSAHVDASPAFDNLVVDAATGIVYNPYSKNHPGRHVCTTQRNASQPSKAHQTYKRYTQRCSENRLCSGVRLVDETGYRDVVIPSFHCCPGWTQASNRSHGCNKPVCSSACLNGGICARPNTCVCQRGFAGPFCDQDVDECKQKPCDQICRNVPGSYRCDCREMYTLLEDGHSCARNDGEIGFEAKAIQFEALDARLLKLEKILAGSPPENVMTKVDLLANSIDGIKRSVVHVADYKEDLGAIRTHLRQLENKSHKVEQVISSYDKFYKWKYSNIL